jgi:hypothetical protein
MLIEIRKDEYQEFVGIVGFLEESLAFIPASPEGDSIEGRLMKIIQSLIEKDQETTRKDAEIDRVKSLKEILQ